MKWGFYFASLVFASILMMVILLVTEPHGDRQHSMFAIFFAMLVFSANLAVLVIYPFKPTDFLFKMVKAMGVVSVIATVILAITCPFNQAVGYHLPSISSQLSSAMQSKP